MNSETYDTLVAQIYEASFEPETWHGVLARIGTHIGVDGWGLIRFGESLDILAVGGERVSAQAAPQYAAYYGQLDPRVEWVRKAQVG